MGLATTAKHILSREKKLLKSLIYTAVFLLLAATASAQNLSVFNLDASNFPTIKAKFYAFDAQGNQQSPSVPEITVMENGIMRNVTSINCPLEEEPKQLSSVLVMDVSGSMGDGSGGAQNIDIAKAAATYWISNVPLGESECAITSFDDKNYFNQDYTTNRNKLASAIAALHPQEGTNYDAALLLPMSGGLEVTKLGKHQRVIVFLSDGLPNFSPQTSAIISEAQKQNCMIFSVTVGLPCPLCLKDISDQTGAKWFENITTQAQIEEVYREILEQAQGGTPCEITWKSDVTCIAGATNVQVAWNPQTVQLSYTPPANSVAQLQIAPRSLYIRSKPVGIKFDTTVTITANNAAFSVTNITSTNPAYDINPKSFSLKSGESKTLTVSYTPPDSSYTWTRFDIATDLCAQTYYASGGFPGHKPIVPTLKLTSPDGGEFLVAGADTVITWKGIPLTDTVKLEYSTNGGSSWNFITEKATGGRYAWHVPKTVSDKCLVRVEQLAFLDSRGWTRKADGSMRGGPTGEAVTTDGLGNIYVTGYFSDTAQFEGTTFTTINFTVFVAKYNSKGEIQWVKDAPVSCSPGEGAVGNSIAVDSVGNIYVTGSFYGSINFEGTRLTSNGAADIFIAKYHSDGSIEWAQRTGGRLGDDPRSVAVDASGNIYITGEFSDTANFSGIILRSNYNGYFIAKYHSDGNIEWAKSSDAHGYNIVGTGICVEPSGKIFITGNFRDTINLDGIILVSKGGLDDIFVVKYHPDGVIEWAKSAGGGNWTAGGNHSNGIAWDRSEGITITGNFGDTAVFGSFTIVGGGGFIAKYFTDGSVEWAKRIGSRGLGIAVDLLANLYIVGSFDGTQNFDGIILTSGRGITDIFVAKYSFDGNIKWAKRAGSNWSDNMGLSIVADNFGNAISTGYFRWGISDFLSDTLHGLGSDNMFIWKIADNFLQSDTSDALFSIVMPQALSEDIDMGRVLVSSAKDSVIKNFIRNGGSYPFRVDSITISGSGASQFALVSGIPPFDIPSGGAHQVEFDFHPTSAGIKNAKINIYTQADTLIQNITGTGIAIDLFTSGSYIDFGKVEIGTYKDTTITAAITNSGNTTIIFSASSQLGPDMKQFSMQSADIPFTLGPGASQSVTLRFDPKFIGRTYGRVAFANNGANSPAILNVFGQALGGLIMIPNDSGYGGDHKDLPLILENESLTSVQSAATNFRARIAYDHSVLSATGANIQTGNKFDTLTLTSSLGSSDTLAFIPFTALSGSKTVSPMRIVDFTWLNGAGLPAEHDAETISGIFRILKNAKDPEPNWEASIVEIYPNPANESFHFQITTSEPGRTQIELINVLGQKVATIFDGELKRGAHDLDFNTHDLRTGSYYLTLTTPSLRKIKKVDVIR